MFFKFYIHHLTNSELTFIFLRNIDIIRLNFVELLKWINIYFKMIGKRILLTPFRGEIDRNRDFDILRSVIIIKKLASKTNLTQRQRENVVQYCRRNKKLVYDLRKKYPIINDKSVEKIAIENGIKFFFWTLENTRKKFKLVTQIGKNGIDVNLKISGFENINQISYQNMILIFDFDNENPYNSSNKRIAQFSSISHAVNHFLGTNLTEEEFFDKWGDFEIRFRDEENFIERFGIGFSFWSDDGKYRRLRGSWSDNHIPILMQTERYRKLKFTIYEKFTAVIDQSVLKEFRCKHCATSFTTKFKMKNHEKECQKETIYHCVEKQYGGDLHSVRKILINENIIPEDDDSYRNFVSFDIECLSVSISLKFKKYLRCKIL